MFGSFVGMLSKLKDNKTVQSLKENISDNYTKIKGQVLRKYDITEVLPQIYHIQFPEPDNVAQLRTHIGKSEFQIWNVSEYKYDAGVEEQLLQVAEQGEVHHLCFSMYSNLPFYQLVLALNTIHRFTQRKDTRVYVHCQDSRIRSALLLACYVYRHRLVGVEDISEAILFVNHALGVRLDEPSGKAHKNLHVLLRNFVNYLHDFHSINKHQLKLLKIIISSPPQLQLRGWNSQETRISIEIKCGETTVLKSTYNWEIIQGNILCATLEKKNVLLGDEFLLVVKYLFGGKAYNVIRIQHNTNFIYQGFTRVQQQDIDTSDFAQLDPHNHLHVDLMFEEGKALSQLAQLQEGGLHSEPDLIELQVEKEELPHVVVQQRQVISEQKAEREANLQAMASLNDVALGLVDENCTTIDILQEINQKLSLANKTPTELHQAEKKEEEEQMDDEDLDDYLSKLQSQA